jgi:hypothetical protein
MATVPYITIAHLDYKNLLELNWSPLTDEASVSSTGLSPSFVVRLLRHLVRAPTRTYHSENGKFSWIRCD